MATVGNGRRGRKIPIGHHIFRNNTWFRDLSAPQPTCWLKAKPCLKDHEDFGHEVSDKVALHPVDESVVADTGCQSTAVPASFAYRIGFRRKDFIAVKMNMNGVDGSSLGIVGSVVLEFSCKDKSGDQISTRQLCYVSKKLNKVYLSRQGCIDLGMLDSDFPTPKNGGAIEVAATHGDSCTCTCPERSTTPPPLPTNLPAVISAEDDKAPAQLKQWLLDHYASTVFNVCEPKAPTDVRQPT